MKYPAYIIGKIIKSQPIERGNDYEISIVDTECYKLFRLSIRFTWLTYERWVDYYSATLTDFNL